MRLSPDGLAFLSHEEGLKTSVYPDKAGNLTIGVGHLLTPSEKAAGTITVGGIPVRYADGLSLAQVQQLLAQDCANREVALSALVICPLEQHQFDPLLSLYYNIGGKNFSGSSVLQILNGGDWTDLDAHWKLWNHDGGVVDPVLVGRRQRELNVFHAEA